MDVTSLPLVIEANDLFEEEYQSMDLNFQVSCGYEVFGNRKIKDRWIHPYPEDKKWNKDNIWNPNLMQGNSWYCPPESPPPKLAQLIYSVFPSSVWMATGQDHNRTIVSFYVAHSIFLENMYYNNVSNKDYPSNQVVYRVGMKTDYFLVCDGIKTGHPFNEFDSLTTCIILDCCPGFNPFHNITDFEFHNFITALRTDPKTLTIGQCLAFTSWTPPKKRSAMCLDDNWPPSKLVTTDLDTNQASSSKTISLVNDSVVRNTTGDTSLGNSPNVVSTSHPLIFVIIVSIGIFIVLYFKKCFKHFWKKCDTQKDSIEV